MKVFFKNAALSLLLLTTIFVITNVIAEEEVIYNEDGYYEEDYAVKPAVPEEPVDPPPGC